MFTITKEFSKTISSPLTGASVVRVGRYKLPQFADLIDKDAKYGENDALTAANEAIESLGPDTFVRFLNWSIQVSAQRRSNIDLRSVDAGLPPSDQADIRLIMNLAIRAAEAETGIYDEKTEKTVIERKSDAYKSAIADSLRASVSRPRFARLEPAFAGVSAGTLDFDLTVAGSFGDVESESEN